MTRKSITSIRKKVRHIVLRTDAVAFFIVILLYLAGCDSTTTNDEKKVIDIVTEAMEFQMPDTIRSGWQTFRYTNKSYETHFFLLDKYPEGKTIEDGEKVIRIFQDGMNMINAGKNDSAMVVFGTLPGWFSEVVFSGGSGLISPGQTAITTLKLEPGYYVVECYVKMPNGIFHSAMGMVSELFVEPDSTGYKQEEADVEINISKDKGIVVRGSPAAGEQIFAVYFQDQVPHEHFVGHDINLVRLEDNADMEALEKWMNWSIPNGLQTPSPIGVTFLGGVNDSPAGSTGYFKAKLLPGKYALISEVPNASDKNMLKTFIVSK